MIFSEKNCVLIDINPRQDPALDDINCFFITRSSGTLINQGGQTVREQINQLTGTITAGAVYGFNDNHLQALRESNSAKLKVSQMGSKGTFLPVLSQISKNSDLKDQFKVPDVFNDKGHAELFAGDVRVMENGVLTTWHTMFVRLHNKCVDNFPSEHRIGSELKSYDRFL